MKASITIITVLLLLFLTRASSAVQEISNIRADAEKMTVWTAVGCSTLLRGIPTKSVDNCKIEVVQHLDAVKVTPHLPGTYRVGAVVLRVLPKLPKANAGFGFYYSPGRHKYPFEKMYFKDMRDHGMNTLTVQAHNLPKVKPEKNAAAAIARQVNNGVSVGLIDTQYPIVCYSVDAHDVVEAQKYRIGHWPELIVQSIDEPNYTQLSTLEKYFADAKEKRIRIGTAIAGYNCIGYNQTLPWCKPEDEGKPVPGIGHLLDIWIVMMDGMTDAVRNAAWTGSKGLWSYMAYPINNAPIHRWSFGLWAWKARTKVNLIWAYVDKQECWDFSRIIETPAGPLTTEAMEGLSEGITDYRVLQAVSELDTPESIAWLRSVEDRVNLAWWPRGYVRDNQHLEMPLVDMSSIRREGLLLLSK